MGIQIYKKGQAALTRYVAAGSCGALLAWGCYRPVQGDLRRRLAPDPALRGARVGSRDHARVPDRRRHLRGGGFGIFLVMNRPTTADLLIDTELEMKKVSWPTRQEAWNSSIVVVVTVLIFTVILFTFDVILNKALQLIF